ncbi:hypothetical protein D5R55_33875 [Burkholderia cenocepacia]|uniref:Uncharacterized protein n=1 Tax=Burkholderia cenocepacia TaxID=95486 RepID=A0A3S9NJ71_9BURK|nr:hypothetical protein D5R55_33875 [Burkholderia cenocepacia]
MPGFSAIFSPADILTRVKTRAGRIGRNVTGPSEIPIESQKGAGNPKHFLGSRENLRESADRICFVKRERTKAEYRCESQ